MPRYKIPVGTGKTLLSRPVRGTSPPVFSRGVCVKPVVCLRCRHRGTASHRCCAPGQPRRFSPAQRRCMGGDGMPRGCWSTNTVLRLTNHPSLDSPRCVQSTAGSKLSGIVCKRKIWEGRAYDPVEESCPMQGCITQIEVAAFSSLGWLIHQGTSDYVQQLCDMAHTTFHINGGGFEL